MKDEQITSSMRFRALLYFLGWQGGTIHQVAQATGLRANQILDEPLDNTQRADLSGFSAIRTCDLQHRIYVLLPKVLNNWTFFSGAIHGFWATGPLDKLNDRWPEHPTT